MFSLSKYINVKNNIAKGFNTCDAIEMDISSIDEMYNFMNIIEDQQIAEISAKISKLGELQ